MKYIKFVQKSVGCALFALSIGGCKKPAPPMISTEKMMVWHGTIEPDPSRRQFLKLGPLEERADKVIRKILNNGKLKRFSFIVCPYYVEIDGNYFGVSIERGDVLVGIDVTGGDARKIPITGTHRVYVAPDDMLASPLLDALYKLYPGDKEGTSK